MWFGRGRDKTVFALPGNPVSTFMCFHRYVKPWLEHSLSVIPRPQYARLSRDYQFKPALTYFLQVAVRNEKGTLEAIPDAGGGSGDFANLRNVDGFLELPLEKNDFKAGEVFPYFSFRG
jgi:molybdopterin molybdotransferase